MASRLVSVVIPVFNGERFLGEAIESVHAQTYEPVELIVVDDDSTDDSAEIAAGYAGVRVVRQRPNGGPAAARNKGIAAAGGARIGVLDADDMMKPERIERQMAAVEGGADFVLTLEEPLLEPGIERPEYFTAKRAPISAGIELWLTTSWLATREALERIGPYDESLRYGEDTDFILRATEAGLNVQRLEERLTIRRFHGGNATYDFQQARASLFHTFKRRIERRRGGEAPPSGTAKGAPPPTEG